MSLPRSVAAILREHVVLEVESIDRMYLNVYVPKLQHERGIAAFFRFHRGQPVAAQGTEPQAAEHMAEGEPLRERREVMAELKFSVDGMT